MLGPHLVRLRPAAHARARIESYGLHVSEPGEIRWQQDPAGNHVARVTWNGGRLEALEVAVELSLDLKPVNPFDFTLDAFAEQTPFPYGPLTADLSPYLACNDASFAAGQRAEQFFSTLPRAGATVPLVTEINRAVHERIRYITREEPGVWNPEETLQEGRGSCRDSAVLLVAALRSRGLAARFVSGYLVQLADEARLPDQATGVSSDVLALHAWAEVFLPGAGWMGVDATSGLFCGEGHVPLACSAIPARAPDAPSPSSSGRPTVAGVQLRRNGRHMQLLEHRVIQSKLVVPRLPDHFAERPRLESRLATLITRKRAVVVTATAGSGKTMAVAGAVKASRFPVPTTSCSRAAPHSAPSSGLPSPRWPPGRPPSSPAASRSPSWRSSTRASPSR